MKKNLTLLLLLCAYLLPAQVTIFPNGSAWKYKDDGSDQGTAWYGTGFNDAAWASGNSQLGYGDGDETTVVNACGTVTTYPSCTNKYITTYFRKTINVASASSYTSYTMNFKRDDAIIVYINGSEVYREGVPSGAVNYTTSAPVACSDDGNTVFSIALSASVITTGTNVIAVEIHQNGGASSDISFEFNLVGNTSYVVPNIVKGPYLQVGTQSSMIVRWETNVATDSKVMYGTSAASLNLVATNTVSSITHTVQLSALTPYTKYYYNIGSSTLVTQGDTNNYFLTSAVPGTPGKYRFWVVGDCGNASTNQVNVKNRYLAYTGNTITNGMLLSGDNAYTNGTDAEYNSEFFGIYQVEAMKKMPLWPAPGNHDYNNGASTATTVPYYTYFTTPQNAEAGGVASNNPAYYSFDYGNIHFISLDSYGTTGASQKMYDTTGAQTVWLKQDLAANNKKWTIAYWHHPPYTMGSHNSDNESDLVAIRQNFIRILERNKVDMIICGHSHDYERSKLMNGHYGNEASFSAATHNLSQSSALYDGSSNSCPYTKDTANNNIGTVYVLSGSAGQLGGQQTSFPHDAMYYSDATNGGSLVLDIEANRLDLKWVCADGNIRDKFTMFKNVNKVTTYTVYPSQTTTLNASWKGNYAWSNTSTASAISVSTSSNASYWVKDANSCVADTFKLKVLPATSFSMSTPYCATKLIQFSDLSTNNSSAWSWSVSPSAGVAISSASAKNPGITFSNTGTYTVTLISNNTYGSGLPYSQTIAIGANPNVLSSISPTAICINQSATLTASGSSAYLWSSGATSASLVVSPTGNTTYTVTGTDPNGCQATSIKTLVVNPLPVITASSNPLNGIICSGDNITLNASGAGTYAWSGGITNGQAFAPSANTSYTVTGTDANGCQNTASTAVTVNPLPALTIIASPYVCAGTPLNIAALGAATYTWNNNATSTLITVSPALTTTYSLTASSVNGCTNTASQLVTVYPQPTVIISSGAICPGYTYTLNPSGASTYTFLNGSSIVNPSATTVYYVTGTDNAGCTSAITSATVAVVNTLTVTINGAPAVCQGAPVNLTAGGASTYTWNTGIVAQGITSTPTVNTVYSVTGGNGTCTNTAVFSVVVNPLPSVSVVSTSSLICAGQSAQLIAVGANTFTWSNSQTGPFISVSPTVSTTYSVTGTDANGCARVTSTLQNVSECTGLENITIGNSHITLYPNPNNGSFNIGVDSKAGNVQLEIFNTLGERVYADTLRQENNNIQLNAGKGIYFYVIRNAEQVTETGKIIIE